MCRLKNLPPGSENNKKKLHLNTAALPLRRNKARGQGVYPKLEENLRHQGDKSEWGRLVALGKFKSRKKNSILTSCPRPGRTGTLVGPRRCSGSSAHRCLGPGVAGQSPQPSPSRAGAGAGCPLSLLPVAPSSHTHTIFRSPLQVKVPLWIFLIPAPSSR